jgi:hypothetical protein
MLWLKGWYETRTRLLILVGLTLLIGAVGSRDPATTRLSPQGLESTTMFGASAIAAILLAGAGIKTQPSGFRPTRGIHGSMYYTLSLPVTKPRLFCVRAALGLVESGAIHTLACYVAWRIHPVIQLNASAGDMFKHGAASFFCIAALYSVGTFFATFLDDFYQNLASMLTLLAVITVLNRTPLPSSFNALLLLSSASPLITHTAPWAAMCALLILSAMLVWASLLIVQTREY